MRNIKNNLIKLILVITIIFTSLPFMDNRAYASGIVEDGKYEIEFTTDLTSMGMMAFYNSEKKLIIEKSKDNYYMTASFDSTKVKDVKLIDDGGVVGEIVNKAGNKEKHIYTMDLASLNKDIKFSVFIVEPMNKTKEFTIKPSLDSAKKLGAIDELGERPARYVPVIETALRDSEAEVNKRFIIPSSRATFLNKDIELNISCYYINNGTKEGIEIINNRILLDNIGEYEIILRAEGDKYKTSLGNNTYTELSFKIISKVGATTLARLDKDSTIPAGVMLEAGIIETGEVKDRVDELMLKLSDHYQIISVGLLNEDGSKYIPSEEYKLYLLADSSYNRNKIKVYHLDANNKLTDVEVSGYGRYIMLNTNTTGNYIIYVPGVEFHMPMWGYASILGGVLVILTGAIATTVIVVRKKKKKSIIGN